MARYAYERLSALDALFLMLEDANVYLHVASVGIFEAQPLRTRGGGIDFEALERATEALLSLVPRYRQKLKWIPLENRPVWVDDTSFYLPYHMRHTSLPKPGSIRQLKRLAARILSQPLDRSKPLWEIWVIEGLEGDRFAIVSKTHHCMLDGIAGVDLVNRMLSTDPDDAHLPERQSFIPRPTPSDRELFVDELRRRAGLPLETLRHLRRFARADRSEAASRARAIRETVGASLRRASPSPLNAPIGPHRRFDWMAMDLAEVKAIRKALGGSVNDLALAIAAGAVRRFFARRGVDPARVDFRILTPVSVRDSSERGGLGNRISAWVVDLPIAEPDPRQRLAKLAGRTSDLKGSGQALGADVLMQAAEWLPGPLLAQGARALAHALPFNMVVTNVPGPQQPWYLLGAKLLESYGHVPLAGNLGLGIALLSYDGRLFWGFNADWEIVPDLHGFVLHVDAAYRELREAAGLQRRPPVQSSAPQPALRERPVSPPASQPGASSTEGGSASVQDQGV